MVDEQVGAESQVLAPPELDAVEQAADVGVEDEPDPGTATVDAVGVPLMDVLPAGTTVERCLRGEVAGIAAL